MARDTAKALVIGGGIAGTPPAQWRKELPRRPSTDRMLLIGDAAHAASLATRQGASMAMDEAVLIAKALRDNDGRRNAAVSSTGTHR